jgi:2-polyprenyl-3-methyl-5-hydroxy-6-metoxy-1,4-benzoquinol methylase
MENWFLPENLKKTENEIKEKRLDELNPNGDFASYKIMLETGDVSRSKIGTHNDLFPHSKIEIFRKKLSRLRFVQKTRMKILNLGCGMGFETKALADVFHAEVLGIDIASDAIEYAKSNFKNGKIDFACIGVDENMKLQEKYDVCFAIEFYPFSRTNDIDLQTNVIKAIFDNIAQNGILVVYQLWDNDSSIRDNVKVIAEKLCKRIYISRDMHKKVNEKIGDNFLSVIALSMLKTASRILKRQPIKPARMIVFY